MKKVLLTIVLILFGGILGYLLITGYPDVYSSDEMQKKYTEANYAATQVDTVDVDFKYEGNADYQPLNNVKKSKKGDVSYSCGTEILDKKTPAIQLFDIYMSLGSTMKLKDVNGYIKNSTAGIKLVAVRYMKRSDNSDMDDISTWRHISYYIVYNSTPEDEYMTNYLVKLNTVDDSVSSIDSINESIADDVYVTGGHKLEESSFTAKANYVFRQFLGNLKNVGTLALLIAMFILVIFVILLILDAACSGPVVYYW